MLIAHIRSEEERQTLQDHLTRTGALAASFARALGLSCTGELLGRLHDLGKGGAAFQKYIRAAWGIIDQEGDGADREDRRTATPLSKIDHSTAGAQWCWRAAQKDCPSGPHYVIRQILALCICSHHGGLIDVLDPGDGKCRFAERIQKKDAETHMTEALAALGADYARDLETLFVERVVPELGAFIRKMMPEEPVRKSSSLCQGACCRDACRPRDPLFHFRIGLLIRLLFSILVDADRIDSADYCTPDNARWRTEGLPDWKGMIDRLEATYADFAAVAASPIDALRADISRACLERAAGEQGIYRLTVPTGGGKTLAALRFALHHARRHALRRIIHVVPYTSIIDQNADVARRILERDAPRGTVVLEHHASIEPEKDTWQRRLLAENWDAPVIYTTMVQFMDALFSGGTRGARRMHRLTGAVLIFDEIQTLPMNCIHLFCNAIHFLAEQCGSTAVLSTATQPRWEHLPHSCYGELDVPPERELMPDVPALYTGLRRVRFEDRRRTGCWSTPDLADFAVAECRRAGSCLAVVNTRPMALKLYTAAREQLHGDAVFHLSTDMCPAHRMEKLEELRAALAYNRLHPETPRPLLCVSTQLIEAGVDVDFAAVIRSLAGLDSILQAAGRCNRNGRGPCGVVSLVNPIDENVEPLRDIAEAGAVTARVLRELPGMEVAEGDWGNPRVIARYFEYIFQRLARDENTSYRPAFSVSAKQVGQDDCLMHLLSCNPNSDSAALQNLKKNAPLERQSFATAGRCFSVISDTGQGVLVPWKEGRELIAEICACKDSAELRPLLRRAQRYTVNVFSQRLAEMEKNGAIYSSKALDGIYFLHEEYYDKETGIRRQAGAMSCLIG